MEGEILKTKKATNHSPLYLKHFLPFLSPLFSSNSSPTALDDSEFSNFT